MDADVLKYIISTHIANTCIQRQFISYEVTVAHKSLLFKIQNISRPKAVIPLSDVRSMFQ